MKKYFSILIVLLLVLSGCGVPSEVPDVNGDKVSVVASFYPIAYMAGRVGGDAARVVTIVPPGIEPHDFELKPQDTVAIMKAKLFFYNGLGIEPWADKMHDELVSKQVAVLRMTDHVPLRKLGSVVDPHIWLDPVIARKITEVMVDAYIKADPSREQMYRSNGTLLIEELKKLDASFVSGLAICEKHDIITAHDSFGYLGDRYDITMHAIAGLSPEAEPTPRQLSALADLIEKLKIEDVFFEDLVTPKLAETLAKEAHAKVSVLHPIEGLTQQQQANGSTYFTQMNENLTTLRTTLTCK